MPVLVAVAVVRMMEVITDEIVHVIAVRHRFVAAAGAVPVPPVVAAAGVVRGTVLRILAADVERVLGDPAVLLMVQVALVQVST